MAVNPGDVFEKGVAVLTSLSVIWNIFKKKK